MTADEIKKEFKYYYSNIHRPGADRLMGYIEQEGFFEAPASRKFHGNYPGGLAEHSVNVTRNIMELGDRYRYWFGYSSETLALVGLLHDLCKMVHTRWTKKNMCLHIAFRLDMGKSQYS